MQLVAIAVGGATGAALRFVVSGLAYNVLGSDFPWGTLAVNVVGSFLIGFLWEWLADTAVSPNSRSLIFTGGLGAFTTFSTYSLESLNLFRDGQMRLGLTNMAVSNGLGILAVFLGFVMGRWLTAVLR